MDKDKDEGSKLPPIVNKVEGEDDNDEPSFASVIAQQADTIKKQGEQIQSLLEAVDAMTNAGANYQQGERPMQTMATAEEDGPDPHEGIKRIDDLDFTI